MMLTIVDTRTCNIQSVCNGFRRIGAELETTSEPATVARADALVLPGVGAIAPAVRALRETGMDEVLKRRAAEGTPILGICLGMQLLAESSTEYGNHACLGLIPGRVIRLEPSGEDCRVPNIGWHSCAAHGGADAVLFPPAADGHSFYFVHSYHVVCENADDVAATFDFGGRPVTAAVERGNVFGVQFHPEKSQDHGLDLLHRFLRHLRARTAAAAA